MKVRVKEYKDQRKPSLKWVVYFPSDDGEARKRKFFELKSQADAWAQAKRTELENLGRSAIALTDERKKEAIACIERLAPYGWTLTQATDFAVNHIEATQRSEQVKDAVAGFLKQMKKAGKSERYLQDLDSRLARFVGVHGERFVAELTVQELQSWLNDIEGSPLTRKHFRRVLSAFFGYCERQGLCPVNLVAKTERVQVNDAPIEVFTPQEMRLMLSKAEGDVLSALVLGGFCGLRDSEMNRLQWENFNWKKQNIDLRNQYTKTKPAKRIVEILPAALAFLEPFMTAKGPVRAPQWETRLKNFKLKIANPEKGPDEKPVHTPIPWKANGLRHSFASYHLAHFKDQGRLALEMGHGNFRMLYRHYREVVEEETAAEWWALRPKKAGDVVQMQGAV